MKQLQPGLYEVRGQLGFLGYQTNHFAYFVELYNPTNESYQDTRHPASGIYAKKTTARKLQPIEITKEMRKQWEKRKKQACRFIIFNECETKT
jgi:hypothetical protein